jgi:hypothetical protein
MRSLIRASVSNWLVKAVASTGLVALFFASDALAAQRKIVEASASGNIVSQSFCSATEVCQVAVVNGIATQLGPFVGTLSERVDVTNGTYTGSAIFTTTDGSTITTEYTGNVTPPDPQGRVYFVETHEVVSGTGRFAGSTGNLHVLGTADAAGKIQIVGLGTLSK